MASDQVLETKTIRTNKFQVDTIASLEEVYFWSIKGVSQDPDSNLTTSVIITLTRDKRFPRYEEMVDLERQHDRKDLLNHMINQQRKWPFLVMAFIGGWFFLLGFLALISPGEWGGSPGSRWVLFLLGVAMLVIGIWRWTVIYKRTKEYKTEYNAHPTSLEIMDQARKLHAEILAEMQQ